MACLINEYTDVRNNEHKVEHLIAPDEDSDKEQIVEELSRILTRKKQKRISA